MTTTKEIIEEIRNFEERLLSHDAGKDVQILSRVLADDFVEFGSSGHTYDKAKTLQSLERIANPKMLMADFQAKHLASSVVLVTYRALCQGADNSTQTLRSSIWRQAGDSSQQNIPP